MKLFYNVIILLCAVKSIAQTPISVKTILKTAFQDEKYRLNQALSQHATSLNYSLPLLQKSEIRLGADDNSTTQQQFGINLFFNTYRETQYQAVWKTARIHSISMQDQWFLHDALASRYRCLIDIYFDDQFLTHYRRLDTLLEQENVLFQASIERGAEIEMKEVFRNETDRNETANGLLESDKSRQSAYRSLTYWLGQPVQNIDFQNFIIIDSIQKVIESLPIAVNHPEIRARNGQIALYDANLKLDKIEKIKILSGIQLGVQREFRNLAWEMSPFARITFNVPIMGNYRRDWNEIDLRRREVENRISVLRYEANKDIGNQRLAIQNLLKQYDVLLKKQKNNLMDRILKNPKVAAEIPVNDLIRIQVIQQKNELTRLKVAQDIVKTYLDILTISGQLSTSPLKDYLHKQLEIIDF
ncbi:MAG: hypothetical protein RIS64_149 [Bacteroidota bacterium]